MSRKSIISFIAVAALAAATLGSGAAQAHQNGKGGGQGPGKHQHQQHVHWKHWHYVHYHDRVYVRPVTYAVRQVTPGPCTCLTKNYTPEGRVVFQDLCTKEIASAPVDGSSDQAQATDAPANMAGQTYQDYLKANPQAQAEPKKN